MRKIWAWEIESGEEWRGYGTCVCVSFCVTLQTRFVQLPTPCRALPTNPSVAPNTPPICSQVAAAAAAEVAEEETGGEGGGDKHTHISHAFPSPCIRGALWSSVQEAAIIASMRI